MHNAMLGPVQERQALDPGRGDVRQRKRVQKRAFQTATAMRDEVGLQKPGSMSVHSVNVRTGIWCFNNRPGLVVVSRCG